MAWDGKFNLPLIDVARLETRSTLRETVSDQNSGYAVAGDMTYVAMRMHTSWLHGEKCIHTMNKQNPSFNYTAVALSS